MSVPGSETGVPLAVCAPQGDGGRKKKRKTLRNQFIDDIADVEDDEEEEEDDVSVQPGGREEAGQEAGGGAGCATRVPCEPQWPLRAGCAARHLHKTMPSALTSCYCCAGGGW